MIGPRKNAKSAMQKNAKRTRNVRRIVRTLANFVRMVELPAR